MSASGKPSISVILPAYNEEANLGASVADALSMVPKHFGDFEIIVVDDGSQDGTAGICAYLVAAHPEVVRVVRHVRNRGYGAALRSGFGAATKELVFFTDSDGQFKFDQIGEFVEQICRVDMVIGYRAARRDPWFRKLNSKIGNLLARTLFGIRVRDINCAYKLIRVDRLRGLSLKSEGAMINTELLASAWCSGWSWSELPVGHHPRIYGKPTGAAPGVILKTLTEYFELKHQLETRGER